MQKFEVRSLKNMESYDNKTIRAKHLFQDVTVDWLYYIAKNMTSNLP